MQNKWSDSSPGRERTYVPYMARSAFVRCTFLPAFSPPDKVRSIIFRFQVWHERRTYPNNGPDGKTCRGMRLVLWLKSQQMKRVGERGRERKGTDRAGGKHRRQIWEYLCRRALAHRRREQYKTERKKNIVLMGHILMSKVISVSLLLRLRRITLMFERRRAFLLFLTEYPFVPILF